MPYEAIQRIKVENGDRVRYDKCGTEMVIERFVPDPEPPRPKEVDVTDECRAELRRSKTSGGHYVAIIHDDKVLFALGVDEKSRVLPFQSSWSGRYHMGHVEGATVSFKITKRT